MCVCMMVCVRVSEREQENISEGPPPKKKKRKESVCLLIYDAVSVINTALLSHLDALIDTCSGEHMGQELELWVWPFPYG